MVCFQARHPTAHDLLDTTLAERVIGIRKEEFRRSRNGASLTPPALQTVAAHSHTLTCSTATFPAVYDGFFALVGSLPAVLLSSTVHCSKGVP